MTTILVNSNQLSNKPITIQNEDSFKLTHLSLLAYLTLVSLCELRVFRVASRSDVVKTECQSLVGRNLYGFGLLRVKVLEGVASNFFSVHNCSRHFNCSHKVEEIVTQVISKCLDLILTLLSTVICNKVVHG